MSARPGAQQGAGQGGAGQPGPQGAGAGFCTCLFDEVHEPGPEAPGLVAVALQGADGHLGGALRRHGHHVHGVVHQSRFCLRRQACQCCCQPSLRSQPSLPPSPGEQSAALRLIPECAQHSQLRGSQAGCRGVLSSPRCISHSSHGTWDCCPPSRSGWPCFPGKPVPLITWNTPTAQFCCLQGSAALQDPNVCSGVLDTGDLSFGGLFLGALSWTHTSNFPLQPLDPWILPHRFKCQNYWMLFVCLCFF